MEETFAISKVCSSCYIDKLKLNFSFRYDSLDNLRGICKSCRNISSRAKYIKGQDSIRSLVYRNNNRDSINKKSRLKYDPEKEKIRKAKQYIKYKDSGVWNARAAKRRANKLRATPSWLTNTDLNLIRYIYKKAKLEGKHVDHIVPLQGKNVSGLHVPWNLQLLTPRDNLSKGNRYA